MEEIVPHDCSFKKAFTVAVVNRYCIFVKSDGVIQVFKRQSIFEKVPSNQVHAYPQ